MPRLARRRWASTMSNSMAACSVGGLAARESRLASRSGMRLRRQEVSASSWTSWVSVGVAGRYSSKKPRRWVSKAAWSSEGRTAEAAVRPWRSAFSAERCLPESVRGPVERRELARLMAVRDAIGVADMGFLATGITWARGAGWRSVREVLIGKRRVWRGAGDCRWTGAKKYGSLHDPVGLRFAPT